MSIAAVDLVGLSAGVDLVCAQPLEVGCFGGRQVVVVQRRRRARRQRRRRGFPLQIGQLRGVHVLVLVEKVLEIAVVHRPSGEQVAFAVGRDAPAHVLAALAEGQLQGNGPAVAVERRAPNLPAGAVQRRLVGHVALADRAVAAEKPDPALPVERELRKIVVAVVHMRRQRVVDVGDRDPPVAAVPRGDAHAPVMVKPRALDAEQRPGVFPPVHAALVPGGPQPVFPIDLQRNVRFVKPRVGDRLDFAPLCAVPGAQQHVVIALVVAVPGDMNFALAPGGDDGFPIVRRRSRNFLFVSPAAAVVAPREDVGLAVAEPLPDEPHAAVRVRRQVVIGVGLGAVAEAHHGRQRAALERAPIEVEVAVNLMRPDEPRIAGLVPPHLDQVGVARPLGNFLRLAPGVPVEPPRQHVVRSRLVGDPGNPDLAVLAAENRGEIVFVLVSREFFRRRHALHDGGAVQKRFRRGQGNVPRVERKPPLRGADVDARPGLRRDIEDDAGSPVVFHDARVGNDVVGWIPVVHALVRGQLPLVRRLDCVFGPGMPIAQLEQFAVRDGNRPVPFCWRDIVEPEAHAERNDAVRGQGRLRPSRRSQAEYEKNPSRESHDSAIVAIRRRRRIPFLAGPPTFKPGAAGKFPYPVCLWLRRRFRGFGRRCADSGSPGPLLSLGNTA